MRDQTKMIRKRRQRKLSFAFFLCLFKFAENVDFMVTDELIKDTYIHSIIRRDVRIIYNTQAAVVRAYFNHGTGNLQRYLQKMPFEVADKTYFFRILPYLRFLDIKYRNQDMNKRRNLALYNRVIWGVLYNETLPDIRYGLTQDIRNGIRAELEKENV